MGDVVKVPRSLLPHRVDIEVYLGQSAYGPRYGAPVRRVRARVEGRRQQRRTGVDVDATSTASAFMRPETVVAEQSRITYGTDTYTVAEVIRHEDLRSTAMLELVLDGPL